jgi:hypothetical protein
MFLEKFLEKIDRCDEQNATAICVRSFVVLSLFKAIDINRYKMPKASKDYTKTVIYRIPVGDENYYGHTTQPLHKRKHWHRSDFNKFPNRKLYNAMRDASMTVDDIELIWVEDFPCESISHAKARERYYIENFGTLNKNLPFKQGITTEQEYKREYRAKNREEILAKKREYRAKNREEILAKRREYYANNRENELAYKREYRAKNREEILAKKRESYAKKTSSQAF